MSTSVVNESNRLQLVSSKWCRVTCNCCRLRTYRPGHDSFASVVREHSFLKLIQDGYRLTNCWETETNCQRLYAFYVYAKKYHSLFSSATPCGLRRLFMTVTGKVNEFHACFQQLRAADWDWTVVNPWKPWCPGGAGHHTHCLKVMAQHIDTLATMYSERSSQEQTLVTQLEKHMCPDLAALVVSYYRNDHAT